MSYVDGLGTSYARSFPASTHARFYLTIRLRARDFYAVRVNEGEARIDYRRTEIEGESEINN